MNYVFRWNRVILEQVTYSYLVRDDVDVICTRFWDHALGMSGVVDRLPKSVRLPVARALYAALTPLRYAVGNMMVAIVVKNVSGR